MYTVDYFIKKFEAIPEDKWIEAAFVRGDKYCANGHCGVNANANRTKEALALADILLPLEKTNWPRYNGDKIFEVTANINDGLCREYKQKTPKQRILAALYDIKKMQAKDIDTGGKVKTVYVAVPVSITDQAKELVLS